MFNIKTVFLAVTLSLLVGIAIANPPKTMSLQACATPACSSYHSERTNAIVTATDDAECNCLPV